MAAEKIAYVIMPYAKEHERLYKIIIKPAVEELGYRCVRQDKTAQGGHIMRNVVLNLANADIVVADLSNKNWNVAYELGIRHALKRAGTVLMCQEGIMNESDENEQIPFDIRHLDVLMYAQNWLDTGAEDEIIKRLQERIGVLERDSSMSDGPVHEVFPDLPENVTRLTTESSAEMQAKIRDLEKKNAELADRIKQAGISGEKKSDSSAIIEKLLIEANKNRIYYSDAAVMKLRELEDAGDVDVFVEFLGKVLAIGVLDVTNCKNIYYMCRRIRNPMITRLFLERAVEMWPEDVELQLFLADELTNYNETREKALVIANGAIGLTRKNGKYEIARKQVSDETLRGFFNVYLSLRQYQELLSICPLLLEMNSNTHHQVRILRNLSITQRRLGQYDEAVETAKKALAIEPDNDECHYTIALVYDENGDKVNSYLEFENCIRLDPDDIRYYRILAGHICDERVARTSVTELPRLIESYQMEQYAAPFILYAWKLNPRNYEDALDFFRRNKMNNALKKFTQLLSSRTPVDEIIDAFREDFTFEFVEYAITKEI